MDGLGVELRLRREAIETDCHHWVWNVSKIWNESLRDRKYETISNQYTYVYIPRRVKFPKRSEFSADRAGDAFFARYFRVASSGHIAFNAGRRGREILRDRKTGDRLHGMNILRLGTTKRILQKGSVSVRCLDTLALGWEQQISRLYAKPHPDLPMKHTLHPHSRDPALNPSVLAASSPDKPASPRALTAIEIPTRAKTTITFK